MKAIMTAKRPVASEKAKPKMAYWKSWPRRDGLRAIPWIRPPKTEPIPAPAPARPTVAMPAPWILAAATRAAAADSATTPRDWMTLRPMLLENWLRMVLRMRPLLGTWTARWPMMELCTREEAMHIIISMNIQWQWTGVVEL